MTLLQQVKSDQIAARKSRDTLKATLLTTLIGEAEGDSKRTGEEITDSKIIGLVQKFIKGANDTLKVVGYVGDVAVQSNAELHILNGYLPQQLTETQLIEIVTAIKAEISATPKDMGKVMGLLKSRHEGQYDGKIASAVVKAALI